MDWVRARKLGHGSFATVSLAIPRSDKTPLMAVKTCIASRAASLTNEKSILEELKDCPEIIRCFGDCFTYEHNEEAYNLLLEYAPNGTLHDKLKSFSHRKMPEREVRHYTKPLLRGLRRIHDLGYVHCDLKPHNILLFPDGGLKIADFGLARKLGSVSTTTSLREWRGTPLYMSPEILAFGEQGSPADVWAVGCIVVEMLTGAPMLRCSNLAEMVTMDWSARVEDVLGKNLLSDVARDFIRRCLERDPGDRWTAEMLLSHPFICGGDDDDGEEEERSMENCVSTSPRCVFDFPEDNYLCSFTSLPSSRPSCSESIQRIKMLDREQSLDWSVSDDWVTVRLGKAYDL